jgi:hypothetical protein
MIFSRLAHNTRAAWSSRKATFTTTTAAMLSSSVANFPTQKYVPSSSTWPYSSDDFTRSDPSSDTSFYDQPRYVAHIDDAAISRLTAYYDAVLPRKGRILDLCTSWHSWYPPDCEKAVQEDRTLEVFGIGLNAAEMARNVLLNPARSATVDLNSGTQDIDIERQWPLYQDSGQGGALMFDCVTCAVSIDYLVDAVKVLKSVRGSVVDGGKVHLVISARCFPTKAVKIWLHSSPEERLQLVGGMLHCRTLLPSSTDKEQTTFIFPAGKISRLLICVREMCRILRLQTKKMRQC